MAQSLTGHTRRELLFIAGAAGAGMVAGLPRDAAAEPGFGGTWEVTIRWQERNPVKAIWTLREDGTFSSSDGFGGTWIQNEALLLVSVRSGTHPAFAGNLEGGLSIRWGIALQPGGIKGYWTAERLP